MAVRMRVPQAAGIRRSVEMQHSKKGVGRMLRRGLHGSKNWVLELEEDGSHRTVVSKALRVAIVLLPLWILLSAFTGGPERGGQSTGIGQSILMAVLVTLLILAFFSARERRLGREEPWTELPAVNTDSDAGEAKTKVDLTKETPTEVSVKPQVGDSDKSETDDEDDLNSGDSGDSAQIEPVVLQGSVQQATSPEAETLFSFAFSAPEQPVQEDVQQAITEGAKREEPDRAFEAIASVASGFHAEGLEEATPEPEISLFKAEIPVVQHEPQEATSMWANVDTSDDTESDESSIGDEPTTPLRPVVHNLVKEEASATESVQVSLEKKPVQQAVQGTLQVQFAVSGPYPTREDPVHEDWWVVAPDIEPEEVAEEPVEAPAEALAQVEEPIRQEPVPVPQRSGRHPQVVLTYLASQAPKSGFSSQEKEQARMDVIGWLREETSSERLTRSEAARRIGVDPSTVSRWLSDDPWAG